MFNKKSSLELSVNAIVIFVLAFAMLGVGLYFVNIIRERIAPTTEFLDPAKFKEPPTADNPITVSRQVDLKRGDEILLDIGYYNREKTTAQYAKVGISECIYYDETSASDITLLWGDPEMPRVTSSIKDEVDPGDSIGYKVIIVAPNELTQNTYTCTMVIHDANTPSIIYEEKEFFLNVIS